MIIDFKSMQETAMEHFKGGEGVLYARMHFDGVNRIMRGRLEKGSTIGLHTHETSSEIIYVLEGVGSVLMDGQEEMVAPGQAHYCPKGHTHSLRNFGPEDLVFLAVVPEQ